MKQICKYDPVRDLCAVDQTGFIDIVKANATSKIETEVSILDEQYNGIDDPRAVGERPSDQFEQQQANKVITSYKPPKKEATSE